MIFRYNKVNSRISYQAIVLRNFESDSRNYCMIFRICVHNVFVCSEYILENNTMFYSDEGSRSNGIIFSVHLSNRLLFSLLLSNKTHKEMFFRRAGNGKRRGHFVRKSRSNVNIGQRKYFRQHHQGFFPGFEFPICTNVAGCKDGENIVYLYGI